METRWAEGLWAGGQWSEAEGDPVGSPVVLIENGVPVGAQFNRIGDVVFEGEVFGPNEPVIAGGLYRHHGTRHNILYESRLTTPFWYTNGVTKENVTISNPTIFEEILFAKTTGTNNCRVFRGYDTAIGRTFSVYAKAGDYKWLKVWMTGGDEFGGTWFDLENGVVGTEEAGYSGEVIDVGGGWFMCRCACLSDLSKASFGVSICDSDNTMSATKGVGAGLYLVLDSIYNSSDYLIYPFQIPTTGKPATMDTAAADGNGHGMLWNCPPGSRLKALLWGSHESQNLITNGDFFEAIDGWSAHNGALLSVEQNRLKQENTAGGDSGAYQTISGLTLGARYELTCIAEPGNAGCDVGLWANNGVTVGNDLGAVSSNVAGPLSLIFEATSDTATVYLQGSSLETAKLFFFDTVRLIRISSPSGILKAEKIVITPGRDSLKTDGDLHLISCNSGAPLLYISPTTGLFSLTDGANVAATHSAYTPGAAHTLEAHFRDGEMWLTLDGDKGIPQPFENGFNPGEAILFGYLNEDMISIQNLYGRFT